MRVQQEGKAPFALNSHDYAVVLSRVEESTVIVLRMAHRIWKESKQQPGTAEPGNMLGCCLISFYFLWAILSMTTVHSEGLRGCNSGIVHLCDVYLTGTGRSQMLVVYLPWFLNFRSKIQLGHPVQ